MEASVPFFRCPREVETLKKRVEVRDAVDPLRIAPCPARYDGLEVQFSAVYAEGFELSALYAVGTLGTLREVEGIWVDVTVEPANKRMEPTR